MINNEIPSDLFIRILEDEFKGIIRLEDVLTCYEIACERYKNQANAGLGITKYEGNGQVNVSQSNQGYNNYTERNVEIFDDLSNLVNPENTHNDNRLKYEDSKLIEGSAKISIIGETNNTSFNRKIFDKNYGEVVLGNLTYTDYLNDNPGIAEKQREKLLIKTLMGYRGFGRYLKRNGRLLTVNSLLLMQSDSNKLVRLLEKKYIPAEEIDNYINYFNKGCDILLNMTNSYKRHIRILLPGTKIPAIYMNALAIFANAIRFGYTNEHIFYGIIRPTDFDQTVFRRTALIDILKTFKRSSMYMLVLRCLGHAEEMLKDLEETNTEHDKTLAMYFNDNLKDVAMLLAYIRDMVENFKDETFEVESLVSDLDKTINYSRMRRCYYDIRAVLKDNFVGTNSYNPMKISKILELFDDYADTQLKSYFDRKVSNSDNIDLIDLGNEILQKIVNVLEEYK